MGATAEDYDPMTNIIAQGDRFKLNLWLWTNATIPAKAWFEIACAKHEYGDFHMPTVTGEHFQTRHVGVDEHGRARVRIVCAEEWANDATVGLGAATCRCNAMAEPFAFPAPVFQYRTNEKGFTELFISTLMPMMQMRVIPSGEPIARSGKYPALAVIYSVAAIA